MRRWRRYTNVTRRRRRRRERTARAMPAIVAARWSEGDEWGEEESAVGTGVITCGGGEKVDMRRRKDVRW